MNWLSNTKMGYPVVDDQYNIATKFNIRADMPNNVEMMITNEGDNGIMFEGTKGRFFVNRGKIVGKPVEDLETNPSSRRRDRRSLRWPGCCEPHRELYRCDAITRTTNFGRLVTQSNVGNLPPVQHSDSTWPRAEMGSSQTRNHRRQGSQRFLVARIPQRLRNQHVARTARTCRPLRRLFDLPRESWTDGAIHYRSFSTASCKRSVGPNTIAAACGVVTFPIGESTTGFGKNRQNAGDIPSVADRIDHQICSPGGNKQIAISVAPTTRDPTLLFQSQVRIAIAANRKRVDLAGDKNGG